MIRAPQPDVLVAGDGSAFAVRGPDGRLAVVKSGGDVFARYVSGFLPTPMRAAPRIRL
jgi:hypothetical protein